MSKEGIMENRYLPGMLYWEKAGQSVWRMYDQLLEIKVLAFRAKEGQQEQLYQMARKLERLNLLDEHFVKILAVKKINEEWFLLFSAKDAEEKKQQIQAVLAAKDLQETEEMPDFSQYREQGRKKEQVLPCGTILNGQYQVLDCVGIGGFGIVYLCQDLYLKRLIAVKEYFPELTMRSRRFLFQWEAGLLPALCSLDAPRLWKQSLRKLSAC